MNAVCCFALLVAGLLGFAPPAHGDAPPSSREIQAAVDAYLVQSGGEADLVGGPGSAGYDQGFWLRGGDFSLKVNLTLQARYEAWIWDDSQKPLLGQGGNVAGHRSGFSLPRATLKFTGTAPCNVLWYVELEFGHFGRDRLEALPAVGDPLGATVQSLNFDSTREAWIQLGISRAFNVTMGQIRTATTRQAMTAPERQQFVDVSLATAFLGWTMPGYTDRNRDHGVAVHGALGGRGAFTYLFTVTNGDGADSIRNVLDQRTSDNLAYSGRLNWAFLNPTGYQEGALAQSTCGWYGEVGAWGYAYSDRSDRPHVTTTDALLYGADLALGYGGFSLTAAWSSGQDENAAGGSAEYTAWLAQLGYLFPGSAWEIALRWDLYDSQQGTPAFGGGPQQLPFPTSGRVSELALGVNYYLNGHGNKLQLDASLVQGDDAGSLLLADLYAGYPGVTPNGAGRGNDTYGMLFRFQWQLAL
jgi:hypothetical protein